MVNAAELKYIVKDIPSIPMFARPIYTINAAKVKGVGVNPTARKAAPGTSRTGPPRTTGSQLLREPPGPTFASRGGGG